MAQVCAAKCLKHNDTNFIARLCILKEPSGSKISGTAWVPMDDNKLHEFVTNPSLFVLTKMLLY